jgi:hypothetical protein
MLRPQNILYVVVRPYSPQRDAGRLHSRAWIAHRSVKEDFSSSPYLALK